MKPEIGLSKAGIGYKIGRLAGNHIDTDFN